MCVKRGFTLIELMIVIAVIGLLSMILVPKVGAIKLQSKNKSVATNVLLVRTYLENRAAKEGVSYQKSIGENKTPAEALTTLLNTAGTEMSSKFYGSSALINPFNGSSSIVYSKGNVTNHSSSVSSVSIYYCTDTLPSSSDEIMASAVLPKGTDFAGDVITVVYSTGYVLYGLNDSGEVISPPYIIKFSSASGGSSGGGSSGDGGSGSGNTGGNTSGNTIGDFFGDACFNVFGDSSDEVNLGNGSTNMNITGSAYLQGKKITFQQNTNVNGDFNILGVGTGNTVVTGNGSGNTLNVSGQSNFQAYDMLFRSNFETYGNVSILGTNSVTFDNAGINAKFKDGSIQMQSNKDINFYSTVNAENSKFYAVAGENNNFNNTSGNFILDSNSSAYIRSGQSTQCYYAINSEAPVTMIAGNNLNFGDNSQSVNIKGKTYLRAGSTLSILRNVTLGDTYIGANTFSYGGASISTSSLNTHVNSFSSENWAKLTPGYTAVSARDPVVPEAVAPSTAISEITTARQIRTLKSSNYTSGYDTTTYPGIAFCIINGSDTSALKQALQPSNVNSGTSKVLIIDGNCTIDGSINNWGDKNLVFDNFIIYCTGKITVATSINSITFNNSSIITKDADIRVNFTMTQPSNTQYTTSIKNEINQICDQYLN